MVVINILIKIGVVHHRRQPVLAQDGSVAPANHATHVNPVAPAQGKNVALAIEQSVAPAQEPCLKLVIQAAAVQCTILR
jgi:hypothetical protein